MSVLLFHILIHEQERRNLSLRSGGLQYCPVSSFCWVLSFSIKVDVVPANPVIEFLWLYRFPACRTACDARSLGEVFLQKTGSMSFR